MNNKNKQTFCSPVHFDNKGQGRFRGYPNGATPKMCHWQTLESVTEAISPRNSKNIPWYFNKNGYLQRHFNINYI